MVKEKSKITGPPRTSSDKSTRNTVSEVRIVRLRVWLTLTFTICRRVRSDLLAHVFADAVEDDDRVVDRETDDGEQRRHGVQGELHVQKREHRAP